MKKTRVLTVVVIESHPSIEVEDEIAEINELSASAAFDVLATHVVKLKTPRSNTYIGQGSMETILALHHQYQSSGIIFNTDILASQTKNLEAFFKTVIIDRTQLILNIFSQRAKSYEGKLQVELAQCRRQLGRLSGLWTHLERQRGGIGLRGGPGEKQIEIDRRLLSVKIKRIEKQIDKISQRNQLARQRRRKNRVMTVTLVGYTNAGKSSLFNILTRQSMTTNDRLFDTLDTTTRRVHAVDGEFYTLSDTVGFIRHLPHELIAGFRATLQDTANSDLLIIVVDYTCQNWQERLSLTEKQLEDIGAQDIQRIIVHNKIDCAGRPARALRTNCGRIHTVFLSCRTSEGISLLEEALCERLKKHHGEISSLMNPS